MNCSKKVGDFREVFNFNCLRLKLNRFIGSDVAAGCCHRAFEEKTKIM